MKIKINIDGNLEIERSGKYKKQFCRISGFYRTNTETGLEECNDHCPLFSEIFDPVGDGDKAYVYLELCNGKTLCGNRNDFIDLRNKESK